MFCGNNISVESAQGAVEQEEEEEGEEGVDEEKSEEELEEGECCCYESKEGFCLSLFLRSLSLFLS